MNEREMLNKIKQDLNYGTGYLKGQVTERLKQSRERALEAFNAQSVGENAYAFAGGHGLGHGHAHGHHNRKWLSLAFISLLLLGIFYWNQQQDNNHDDNIDAALLASDIPLNAFVDQNFHTWLDRSSQH